MSSESYSARTVGWTLGAALALLGLPTLYVALSSWHWPLMHDAPLMHYIAWRLADGATAYRDLFDMNLPGAYFIHSLLYAAFGAADLPWRLFDLAWLALTATLLALYCRPFGGWAAALATLLFCSFHLAKGPGSVGQRDFLILPFILLALLSLNRFLRTTEWRCAALAGLALGASLTIKPQLALLFAFFAAAMIVRLWKTPGTWLRAAALLGVTGIVFPAAMFFWLWRTDALAPFLDIMRHYLLPFYSQLSSASLGKQVESFIRQTWVFYLPLPLLPLAYNRRELLNGPLFLPLVGLAFGTINYFVQNKNFNYHLYPCALFLTICCAAALTRILTAERAKQAAVLAAVLLLAWLQGLQTWQSRVLMASLEESQRRIQRELQRDIQRLHRPGGTVQVMDTTSGGIEALLRLKIRQPSRFIYDFHFYHDTQDPRIQRLRAELLAALREHPPQLIALCQDTWLNFGYERLERFPELRDWLSQNYRLETEGFGYRLYVQP
ncbi:MAG TPA: glycosyltransferase family 39 protein [bacterium]|nr:glycosyltransferase family 39 protein [bacterium]